MFQAVYRKYYLIQQGMVWSDAVTYCRATYTDLATIADPDEAVQVRNLLQSQNFVSSLWIGLYNDVNSWRWSMGNETLGSFTAWYFPNPDNYHAVESCGAIFYGGWLDCACAALYPFICFDGKKQTYSALSREKITICQMIKFRL